MVILRRAGGYTVICVIQAYLTLRIAQAAQALPGVKAEQIARKTGYILVIE